MSELKEILINISEEKRTKIIPDNLKVGVNAFGVDGTFTADGNATAADILKDKTAYVNGEKVTGTMEADSGEYNVATLEEIPFGSNYTGLVDAITIISGNIKAATTSARQMFYHCRNLIKLEGIDTTGVTTTEQMFYYCDKLPTVPLFDTSSVTNMTNMFSTCYELAEIPFFDTSKVSLMTSMFNGCKKLTNVPLLNTSSVTDMSNMFYGCSALTTVPLFDTSKVTKTNYMFYQCSSLTTVPQLDFSSVTNVNQMFASCANLTDESLNNIMASCVGATAYTGTKTLKQFGITSAQATKCQSLSNYQAFLDAGWTTGY